ncbi:hypothetical protein ACWJIM_04185 [Proteus mirabilis]|uniref:hypothetical protein n=1 Tax=Proteus vulgaris TaxID=585 RepID=UPI002556655D|nr:hypothetical protein [Proteus vulgaris]GLX62563.1 hypothetical protein KMU_06030 [Proteus vulgaris]
MSRLAHLIPKKQFRCLPLTKEGTFRYVESIPSNNRSHNYRKDIDLVDKRTLKKSWADFYFLSGGKCNAK